MFNDMKSILPDAVRRSGMGRQLKEMEILKIFSRTATHLLGGETGAKIKPMYLERGVLKVASLSDFATAKLKISEQEIINIINSETGVKAVKRIKFLE